MPFSRPLRSLRPRARWLATRRFADFILVAAGLVAMAAYSAPGSGTLDMALQVALWTCVAVFALEWALSIRAAGGSPAYWRSLGWVVDALAVLPAPVALLAGAPARSAWLLGCFWLLKLVRMSTGLARLGRVIAQEAGPLGSVLVMFVTVLFFAAAALHLLERQAQPQAFGSLPSALWWAVATLTTTGYGDAVPITLLGRVIGGLVMISGVGVFGLLTGILATGFVEESRRHNFVETWRLVKSVPFFSALDAASVIELSRRLRRWDVPEGIVIVTRGRTGDCMYFITSGEVEVELQPAPVRLGRGAFFGELALLGNGVRSATVRTVSPVTLLILDVADFQVFCASHHELAQAIAAEAQARTGAPAKSERASTSTI